MAQASAGIDLNEMSKDELQKLQKDIDKAIKNYDERQRKEALAAAEATAKEMGFSLAELTGGTAGGRKAPLPPKYRHPDNPSLTWSGRGRQPNWYKEAIESGTPEEDLLIETQK